MGERQHSGWRTKRGGAGAGLGGEGQRELLPPVSIVPRNCRLELQENKGEVRRRGCGKRDKKRKREL